ncbi:MAG TPA: bis-aminopropyl spermidine synthase family protein [Candidatus Saccharimonadales bacterium]|nr:bis-aminopropyl spermidine synthase family protein [Candidatus Saccharimonadales bacterium]
MNAFINDIKTRNADLKLAEIEGILYIVRNTPNLSNNELVRQTGLTKEILKQFKSSIASLLDTTNEDLVRLNQHGTDILSKLEISSYKWSLFETSNLEFEEKLKLVRQKYNLVAKREYDQFFATEATSVAKASILNDKGLVEGANIALLGDDDLVSITLGTLFKKYNRITVLDVDNDILDPIKQIVIDNNLQNISTKIYDVRKELKPEDAHRYDIVMTDPPYTPAGVALFLRRAVELLSKSNDASGKYIYLFYANSLRSPEKTLKIQEIIEQYNLVIEDKIDKFSRYYGAETIGSQSSLYILKTTPQTKPIDNYLDQAFYTFEDRKEEKFPYVDHFTFKIYDVPHNIVTSKKALLKATNDLCETHKLKIVDTKITEFKKQGLTITFVLGTSNLLVHTWPELNALHIDLISCSPIYSKDNLIYTVSALYGSKNVEMRKID